MSNNDKNKQQNTATASAASAQTTNQEQPLLQTGAAPEVAPTSQAANTLSSDEVAQLTLLKQVLGEYGPAAGFHVDMRLPAGKAVTSKLHHAFRILFGLRGEAFKQGFALFIEAINECKTKAYHPKVVNANLELINEQEEAGVFVTFINYASRFARVGNKSKFAQNNDIPRLTNRLLDPELVSSVNDAFLVNG